MIRIHMSREDWFCVIVTIGLVARIIYLSCFK